MKKFRVKGTQTPFPIDLLRREECWPETIQDSEKIKNSFGFRHGRRVRWEVGLVSMRNTDPDVSLWESYACQVCGSERIADKGKKPDSAEPKS